MKFIGRWKAKRDFTRVLVSLQKEVIKNWETARVELIAPWNTYQYYRFFEVGKVSFKIFCSIRADLITVTIDGKQIAEYVDQTRQYGIGTNDESINIAYEELKKALYGDAR